MNIIGEAIVSCYADMTSLLVMILLLILADRLHKRENASMQILYYLSLCITATCIFSFICHAAYRKTAPIWHTAAFISRTLWEYMCFWIIINWVAFVTCKLFGPEKRRSRIFYLVTMPFMIFTALLVVNLFTGIVFTYSADNRLETGILYTVIVATEFFYFIVTAVICHYYDRKSAKIRFLNITPMILSVSLAVSVQFFSPYQIDVLGFVIGVTLLYFSMVSEFRFVDEESGLYNRGYLAYLFDFLIVIGYAYKKNGYRCSATVFRYALVQVLLGLFSYITVCVLSGIAYWLVGGILILLSTCYSLRILRRKTHLWQALMRRFRSSTTQPVSD